MGVFLWRRNEEGKGQLISEREDQSPDRVFLSFAFPFRGTVIRERCEWDSSVTIAERSMLELGRCFVNDLLIHHRLQNVTKEEFSRMVNHFVRTVQNGIELSEIEEKHMSSLSALELSRSNLYPGELLVPIRLEVPASGGRMYQDSFEWDVLCQDNNIYEFASLLVKENDLPSTAEASIVEQIRTQINSFAERRLEAIVKSCTNVVSKANSKEIKPDDVKNSIINFCQEEIPFVAPSILERRKEIQSIKDPELRAIMANHKDLIENAALQRGISAQVGTRELHMDFHEIGRSMPMPHIFSGIKSMASNIGESFLGGYRGGPSVEAKPQKRVNTGLD
eukprot:TRINITY_DN8438_c0_g1_i1.p1 TRINITY_DN8438_c0_g1~~TRINITY_DN8438_c0_g1_i1.p1  ORF type:complete len:336 (-),score=62.25 TRINITY_DN8438_c0_g1_i1:51-1058(-)